MFGLSAKRTANRGRTGLVRAPEGVAVAQVTRDKAMLPRLSLCRFIHTEGSNDEGSVAKLLDGIRLQPLSSNWVMAGEDYQLLLVEAPDVEPGELRAAVRWRIRDLIDFHIDDAVIDVFDVPGQKSSARARMMYVVACRAPVVRKVIDALEEADFDLQVIDIAELAMRNVAALLEEDVNGVALLHLERDYGLITISRQTSLYLARKLEIGYGQLAEAFASDGGAEAEFPGPALSGVLQQVVLEVQRSLDYYESHLSRDPASVLYLDPPVGLPSLAAWFEQNLGVGVRELDLNRVLDCGEQELDVEQQSRCLLAVGAALRMEQAAL